jgi:hypothetical protein
MKLTRLYNVDETAWLEESVRLIKERRFQELDFKNLEDYLESSANRDKREVGQKLTNLLANLLEWQIKAKRRTGLWSGEILGQKMELLDILSSTTLRDFAQATLQREYVTAVRLAAIDADIDASDFPSKCPYSLKEILDEDYYPEGPLEKKRPNSTNGVRRRRGCVTDTAKDTE